MTRTERCGGRIEHEGRPLDDETSSRASSALGGLVIVVLVVGSGLWHGVPLALSLGFALLSWGAVLVGNLLHRRRRVWITAGEVVVRTHLGRTVRVPRESVATVLHLRSPGPGTGLVSLLDDEERPLLRFWTREWSEETVAALLRVGRQATVEDVPPEEDEPTRAGMAMRRAASAGRRILHALLVAFGLACLALALLILATA